MIKKSAPAGTQSVIRAVALLKAFTSDGSEMDLAELTDRVGLSRTTTHRLLAALESEGLIARNPDTNDYRLGPAAISLGTQALRNNDLRASSRRHLEALAEKTGETATLEILSDGKMLILDEVLGRHLVGTAPTLGTAWPVHATSTGKALLAAMEPEQRQRLLEGPLDGPTPHTITDPEDLAAELETASQRGYATVREELEFGYVAAAAAIIGPLGNPVGCLCVGGPSVRLTETRLEEVGGLVRQTAQRLSEEMGAHETWPA